MSNLGSLFIALGWLLLLGWPQADAQENQNLSGGRIFEGEPNLAVNPTDPDHLVVAWMGFDRLGRLAIHTRTSTDGGKTWRPAQKLGHEGRNFTSADPTMAFDQNGKAYLAYIDYNRNQPKGGIYIRKTQGVGQWTSAQPVVNIRADSGQEPIDRPWLAVDRSGSSMPPRLYLSSMNSRSAKPPFHPYFFRSSDRGSTWSAWQYLDSAPWLTGRIIDKPMPSPAVGADGTFYAVYPSLVPRQRRGAWYVLARSDDGGRTFQYQSLFKAEHALESELAKKGYLLRTDPSDEAHLVFIYLANPLGDADVYLRESFDKGASWRERVRINDDMSGNGRMQDLLWADFNQKGGLFVAWRDRREAETSGYRSRSAIYGAYRPAGRQTFDSNIRLADQWVAYDSILAKSGNDFMDVALVGDTVHAVWGDTRTGNLNIWYQRYVIGRSNQVGLQAIGSNAGAPLSLFPNPAKKQVTITLQAKNASINRVRLMSDNGQLVQAKSVQGQRIHLSLDGLPTGRYNVMVNTSQRVYHRSLIVE